MCGFVREKTLVCNKNVLKCAKNSLKGKKDGKSKSIKDRNFEIVFENCAIHVLQKAKKEKPENIVFSGFSGAPGAIRTRDVPLRRRTLCPAEVQAQKRYFDNYGNDRPKS